MVFRVLKFKARLLVGESRKSKSFTRSRDLAQAEAHHVALDSSESSCPKVGETNSAARMGVMSPFPPKKNWAKNRHLDSLWLKIIQHFG